MLMVAPMGRQNLTTEGVTHEICRIFSLKYFSLCFHSFPMIISKIFWVFLSRKYIFFSQSYQISIKVLMFCHMSRVLSESQCYVIYLLSYIVQEVMSSKCFQIVLSRGVWRLTNQKSDHDRAYTVKKAFRYSVPNRDITCQTLPRQE